MHAPNIHPQMYLTVSIRHSHMERCHRIIYKEIVLKVQWSRHFSKFENLPNKNPPKQAQGHFFFKLGFTPYKAEQPLQGMELQEKETQKD